MAHREALSPSGASPILKLMGSEPIPCPSIIESEEGISGRRS
ncbi:MAG: hypothetical protein ABSG92_10055 [Conexivisphaerales archaeon]